MQRGITEHFTYYLDQLKTTNTESVVTPVTIPHNSEHSSTELLPTTLKIATKGAKSFAAMTMTAGEIISPRLSLLLYASDPYADLITNCFVGTTPEVTITREGMRTALLQQQNPVRESEAEKIVSSFEDLINQIPGFMTIPDNKTIHLINLDAIYQVMANHYPYFIGVTPVNFLSWYKEHFTNSQAIETESVQYGLMSGFPLQSTLEYKYYFSGIKKIVEKSPEKLALYVKAVQIPVDEETVHLVVNSLSDLTPEEKNTLLKAKRFMWSNLPQFASFSPNDEKYMMELNSLYEESGIRNSFKQIHKYLAERLPDMIKP